MKILVADDNGKISLSVIRAFPKDYIVHVFSDKKNTLCSYSNFCTKFHILPSFTNKNFNKKFLKLLKVENYDLIIPVNFNSFFYLSKLKKKINSLSNILIESHEKIKKAASKIETYKLAKKINVKHPKTIELKKEENLKKLLKGFKYPLVIKPKFEQGKSLVYYANNFEQLRLILKKIKLKHTNIKIENFLIQEKINGQGCGYFALRYKNKILLRFQHLRKRELPITGGKSVAAKSFKNRKLNIIGDKFINKINWQGVLMLEFKYYKNNFYLIEVNPKFWGSLDLAIVSGSNFPISISKIYNNKINLINSNYRNNFNYQWPLDGDITHGILRPTNFINVLFDLMNVNVKSNLWLIKDTRVSFEMIKKFIISYFKAIKIKLLGLK